MIQPKVMHLIICNSLFNTAINVDDTEADMCIIMCIITDLIIEIEELYGMVT